MAKKGLEEQLVKKKKKIKSKLILILPSVTAAAKILPESQSGHKTPDL